MTKDGGHIIPGPKTIDKTVIDAPSYNKGTYLGRYKGAERRVLVMWTEEEAWRGVNTTVKTVMELFSTPPTIRSEQCVALKATRAQDQGRDITPAIALFPSRHRTILLAIYNGRHIRHLEPKWRSEVFFGFGSCCCAEQKHARWAAGRPKSISKKLVIYTPKIIPELIQPRINHCKG